MKRNLWWAVGFMGLGALLVLILMVAFVGGGRGASADALAEAPMAAAGGVVGDVEGGVMPQSESFGSAPQRDRKELKKNKAMAFPAAPKPSAIGGLGFKGAGPGGGGASHAMGIGAVRALAKDAPSEEDSDSASSSGEETAQASMRSWFPETFLFEPLIVTDDHGNASVPVKVPDRLTRWRVLGLAHARNGAQSGAVTELQSTLPAYVEPVVPSRLMAGDEVRLPIQIVNTTEATLREPLHVVGMNLAVGGAPSAVSVPPRGSSVEYVKLSAPTAGRAQLQVGLGATDAITRSVEVIPQGQPLTDRRSGALSSPRSYELTQEADAIAGSTHVRLVAYPGALALLRSELSASSDRSGAAEDAYALLLAGEAPALLKSLGEEADPEAIRTLTLTATQRVMRYARSPDVATAALLAQAALAHPKSPLLSRLGERLASTVAASQRPDGSCQGADGWTLQRLLVTTSDCVRAVNAARGTEAGDRRARGVQAKAEGVFERSFSHIQDGYTAAAVLASGAVEGKLAEALRDRVKEAITASADGARTLRVERDVVRADGEAPSIAEATGLAILALKDDPQAPLADLGAGLLGSYSPAYGFGDGRANLVCLRALLTVFQTPMPARVQLTVALDGKTVAEGTLEAKALREVATLEAPASLTPGPHTWTVKAEPAVPGMGFSLAVERYVPWKAEKAQGGLELTIQLPRELKRGTAAEIQLTAVSPAGVGTEIAHSLPAGVQPDTGSLDALQRDGQITSYKVVGNEVQLTLPAHAEGAIFRASYRVIPTLSGVLHANASTLEALGRSDRPFHLPPTTWAVRDQ